MVYSQGREKATTASGKIPKQFFGGKESTKFDTDINDKHLSFDEKIPTLKSGKTKVC